MRAAPERAAMFVYVYTYVRMSVRMLYHFMQYMYVRTFLYVYTYVRMSVRMLYHFMR